ncbi:ubiquitin carboxyl-terminal hydrolase puf isoform X1 [Rhagoletis pomonella]|uniref:ubiquitin carboxyl-terminal hydrolase puf isoform X1 n=1 Tax=Rhagoletis pomonella TaxID=28610 RepID=UPI00177FB4A6|nr:ubiquitin carboxyl-terminal hydrolase puf isoform X1 [Rhagoletis pomonella]
MCDVCSDFLHLLESYEIRITSNDAKHSILLKSEIETAFGYIQAWPQRQCMCLYRDPKNFERFNLVVQSMICLAVHHLKHIERLIDDYKRLTACSLGQTTGAAQTKSQSNAQTAGAGTSEKNTNSTSDNKADKETGSIADNGKRNSGVDGNNTEEIKESKKPKRDGSSSPPCLSPSQRNVTSPVVPSSPPPPAPSMHLPDSNTNTSSTGLTSNPGTSISYKSNVNTASSSLSQITEEPWILPEVEKLFILVSKVFLLNFPLYIAYKHGTHARLDDISAEEAQHLAIFCDLHDNEIPVYLLRNITLFCNSGGFAAMMLCFEQPDLPVTTAQAITATVSNIKLWLNYGCIVQLFVPLRSRVLQYMCKLSDQNLRSAATRAMADFVWSAVRDPLDASVSFDVEGLALAFKYFTSTTLTMRLAGMAQINAHINLFNEICTTETVGEVEIVGQKIANWLTENQIIQHLFGPNLHVEVIKQAHVVLNFLAVENQITEEHIKLIWQATQLKHCSKTIFDILPALVKNLAPRPAMHLYSLLCRMDPKEHTEQSIYIASALTKLIWSRDNSRAQMSMMQDHLLAAHVTASSSDSGSMDGSNSDDEPGNGDDSSLASGTRKSPIDIENVGSDTGAPPPCKQARHRRHACEANSEDKGSRTNVEDLNLINQKLDMKMQNHRIVNIIDNSSSEDDLQQAALDIQMHRKKSRKRRKNSNLPLTRLAHEIVEAIWDGGEDEDATSDDADDADEADGEVLNDSDDCSDTGGQVVPSAVLKHLRGEGPYIRAIDETHISELLNGAEIDGYSSPMSNKSEKNMADFDDEDVSPCEEELSQLHALRVSHNCVPPAFAAAAMAAAHSSIQQQQQKSVEATTAGVVSDVVAAVSDPAANAAAVAVAAAACVDADLQQQVANANAAAIAAALAAVMVRRTSDSADVDMLDNNSKVISPQAQFAGRVLQSVVQQPLQGVGQTMPISPQETTPQLQQPTFKINDVCQPGNTLLWDLLQDDKIFQLGESLALEAEKALATLLCFSMDRQLRTKFIEGCLQNLASNRSVVVSLRLLPKLFASFQHFRPADTHHVTMWAERQHRMMYHFFNNIKFYAKRYTELQGKLASGGAETPPEALMYSHKTQVSVRLHFLSSIFSTLGSPKTFRLTLEQVDSLWEWLAHDSECSDCYFSWLQSQAKGGDQHALGIDALQHLYLKKLPELRPEEFSMVALGLFQQLCSLARMAIAHYEKQTDSISSTSSNIVGMYHLWKIALRAHNTEVSLAAIQYINMYYMGQQLRLEKEFVSQCMDNLVQATNALESNEDENALMCVQRGLMLLNTHLETFRRRYAFHLRRWAIEGKGMCSHSNLKNEAAGPAIRIVLQPAGLSEKSVLHMHACDLIAELKAEISKWWENLQGGSSRGGVSAPVLGLLLSDGPLRIITQGQELTSDYDERSLGDAGFKDNQIVYVSLGGRGARRKETNLDHPSMQPPPPKECLPTVLLLQPRYFEKLFCLMQTLGDMKPQNSNLQLHTKAQLLSRRVWDILAILPTNPLILDAFKGLSNDLNAFDRLTSEEEQANKRKEIKQKLNELLDVSNLQKFMYSLHIVESLTVNSVLQQKGGGGNGPTCCGFGGGGVNGNVIPMDQYVRSTKGGSSASKRSSSRRRNSNESLHAKDDSKRNNSGNSSGGSSSCSGSGSGSGCGSGSASVSSAGTALESLSQKENNDGAVQKESGSASAESEFSNEMAGEDVPNHDKENNQPLAGRPHKRLKRSDSNANLNDEKDSRLAASAVDSGSSAAGGAVGNGAGGGASVTSSGNARTVHDMKWSEVFVRCGGLRLLYEIFISGQLQQSAHPREMLNEWRHDCLASLLRVLWLLGFEEVQADDMHVVVSRPHAFMLELMNVDPCLRRLAAILNDEAYHYYAALIPTTQYQYQYPYQYHHLRTGFWGRAQVVQFTMNIMVSFVHASAEARRLLWTQPEYCSWVQKFILEDPEPAVRREICAGLYRICLGNAQSYQVLLAPLLRKLISFLPLAENMTSYVQHTQYLLSDEGKEPYGPACRDYFWLLARLVDTMTPDMVKCSLESDNEGEAIDIERLCQSVSQSILSRDFFETRHGYQDDGLVGLINLMSNFVKYDPTFKFSGSALQFIDKIFEFLFDMPSPMNRHKPKCKSATSRAAAYDLLVELCKNCPKNYVFLHAKLLAQHTPGTKAPYPWDYWPRDEGRSECGFVGLTNLGATCYMASCIQHLYMMPQARAAILNVPPTGAQKHGPTLLELQRMFAYLLESERKAYNPRSFCRVYQMDHQPLNTGEQKDMAEFFIDLVSKLEEMTPELKDLVKRLFCGTLSNNVVSLDCGHVSRTAEEFYTVRCQVADMRNLQESLDEVTVKDTLEGDNMYTCSQCGKKVRAEKRACFKKLPQILCFNTMRYTFNMVTMLKEKVNTHFSFPMVLSMADYVEKTLMPHQYKEEREKRKQEQEKQNTDNDGANKAIDEDIDECLEYELVGVTVHTGTADGGHYYSFIKERNKSVLQHDRWFLFNDAEVKPFDPSQIAAECFGGEMTSKTYDSVTEKYMDFSFEKTNSAYMLFYERRLPEHLKQRHSELLASPSSSARLTDSGKISAVNDEVETVKSSVGKKEIVDSCVKDKSDMEKACSKSKSEKEAKVTDTIGKKSEASVCDADSNEPQASTSAAAAASNKMATEVSIKSARLQIPHLNKELEDWIWQDNRQFLQDRNIFEHTYFNFMWQICGHIPQTLLAQTDVTCMAAKLSVSFFIETFIHAKEKPTMVPWIELLTKQFNASQEACEWFLTHMSIEPWWPVQVLIQCPNQMVRQMFQRLVIHVIQRLRSSHAHLYLKTETDDDGKEVMGNASCVTRFISSLILLMEHGAKAHLRHLSEFFGLLFEFSRMGDEETVFLLRINVIKSVADFYLGNKTQDCIDVGSDNDDNSSDEALSVDKTRPASLDKMIALVANLVERSRGQDFRLRLSTKDYNAIAGGKGFPFLYQQIKDNINPHQTKHLIHALCRWDDRLANQIITMLFSSVTKHTELCGPFFKLLTLLTETQGGPSGLPCFSQLVLQRVWDAAEYCPQSALDWLAFQAPKNKIAHAWILQSADNWVEQYLLAHNNSRVRNAAAYLLVSLVPSQPFRANFRTHSLHKLSAHVYRDLNSDAQIILHNIINLLLRLLRSARAYADIGIHGTTKLTTYFSLLSYCMVSKTEKLMIGPYMRALWDLFHPRLSEPSVPAHHNKHALLAFWHHSIVDCPENALIVANCHEITRNIAFNYILADHDDSEIVAYNRAMLPAYYGLLRLCCEQSRALTRQLAAHQNLQWAFKNITPHPTQYAAAVDELFKLMTLFATRHPDASEQEQHEVTTFRRTTLSAYLTGLDARVSWGTLINALRILVDNDEDRLLVIYNGGIEMCFEALHTLHSMHHEATACHVSGDLQELLSELVLLLTTLRMSTRLDAPTAAASVSKKQLQQQQQQQQRLPDAVKRLATFLNTFNPPEICRLSLEVLKELVRNPSLDVTSILAPILINCHLSVANAPSNIGPLGPYFPRRGTKAPWPTMSKNTPRPPRPMVQMSIPHGEILQKGVDIEYDAQVEAFYRPYHDFLDVMMRMAVNTNQLNETLVKLSCLVAIEAAPLHLNLFAKFWVGIHNNKSTNKYAELLINNQYLVEYIHVILRDERVSLSDHYIRNFLEIYYPKISAQLPIARLLYTISYSMHSKEDLDDLCGDLFAIRVIAQCTGIPTSVRKQLRGSLKALLYKSSRYQEVAELEITQNKKVAKVADSPTAEKESAKQEDNDAKDPPLDAKEKIESPKMLKDVKESAEDMSMELDTESDGKKDANNGKNGAEAMETDKSPSSGKSEEKSEDTNKNVKVDKGESDQENTAKTINAKPDKDDSEEKNGAELKGIAPKTTTTPTKVSRKDIEDNVTDSSHSGNVNAASTTVAASAAAATLVEQCKSIQKKPAEVRLFEEHEKRIKLLLTMETYIKSILVLMQRDESCTSPTSATVSGAAADSETGADGPEISSKKSTNASVAATSIMSPPESIATTSDTPPAKNEDKLLHCSEKSDVKGDASNSHQSPANTHTSTTSTKDDNNSATNPNTIAASQPTTTTTPTPTISAATAAALHSQQI